MKAISLEKFGNYNIPMQAADGYIHATTMCKIFGKDLAHYKNNDRTKAYIQALSSKLGIPSLVLIRTKRGGFDSQTRGTWVHPKIAIHLGQWLSPEFAVFVTELVFDWQQKAIEPPKVARIAQEKPKKEKIEPVEQVWPERETVLSEQQLASLQENIAMSVENCWPRGGVVRTVGEYCTAVAKHFGVFSYQDILQTDYAAAIGFVVGYANCKSNQQKDIILRVFDGRKDLTDAEMFERSLADVVGQAMNLVRERPVKRGLLG